MTAIELPYVQEWADRDGRVYRYFRRRGCPRIPLPGVPGSAEFMDAYQAAVDRWGAPARQRLAERRNAPGSFDALAVSWYGSARFLSLAESTRYTYRRIVERLREAHGARPAAKLTTAAVKKLLEGRGTAAAGNLLDVLRQLCRHGVDIGLMHANPCLGVKAPKHRRVGFHTWTEEEIGFFEARWPIGTRERLALALLLCTGSRRSDAVRIGRQHIRDGTLTIRQKKTGRMVVIPVHPDLAAVLAAAPAGMTFLVTETGAPFTVGGFYNWFVDRARMAGLPPGCSPHGLRKGCARRLAEAGATAPEIAAVLQVTIRVAQIYVEAADQAKLARAGMARLVSRFP